jgi:hypothetical protein
MAIGPNEPRCLANRLNMDWRINLRSLFLPNFFSLGPRLLERRVLARRPANSHLNKRKMQLDWVSPHLLATRAPDHVAMSHTNRAALFHLS